MAAVQLWGDAYDLGEIPLDDLVALWGKGATHELWEGRLVQETMTYPLHGATVGWIHHLFIGQGMAQGIPASHVVQHTLFNLTQPGQLRTVLAPDVAILPMGAIIQPRVVPSFAPWLAVEVISPTQTMTEIRLKAQAYMQAGTGEVWIVDPEQVLIEIITPNGTTMYRNQQTILSTILPGFTPTVRSLIP